MAAPARFIREVPTSAIAPISVVQERHPIVIVLGMDGTGTALCSRVLSALGVRMTDRAADSAFRPAKRNGAADHWERPEIADFHHRILDLFNPKHGHPSDGFALPVAWRGDARVVDIRREMTAFVGKRVGADLFGFMEQCTARLMPIWHQIANELRLTPKVIYCLRNPAHVARALQDRDGLPLELVEYRWFAYTLDAFRHTKTDICTIEYDSWFDDYGANLKKLQRFLNLPEDPPEFENRAISMTIEAERRIRQPALGEASKPLIRSVYKLAQRAEVDPAAREQLQSIATQFLSFQQLHAAGRDSSEDAAAARDASIREVPAFPYCISPASFWQPEHILPSAWYQHAPFAFWITEALRPEIFVELGTHHGFSYLVFCQAVQRLGSMSKCYAVDTWKGDTHAGFYDEDVFAKLNDIHEPRYSGFSRLVRSTFDEALPHFGDGTIDLLHIDGRHGYEDVAHDFESWLPKLSDRAVVLFHDINVRERGFGVWQFWADLQSRYPCFEFTHGHGLGVVQVGSTARQPLRPLFESGPEDKAAIAEIYAQLGRLRESETRLAAITEHAQQSDIRAAEALAELERQKAVYAETIEQRAEAAQRQERELAHIRRQLGDLRDAVTLAEREAQERVDAEAAIRAEMADAIQAARGRSEQVEMLKSELDHARQVGLAALQALAASIVGTVYREPRLGWRHALRRLLGVAGDT